MMATVIESARKAIVDGDTNLACFIMRDLAITEELGLSDLAWEMYRSPYVAVNEATWLVDQIAAALKAKEVDSNA